MHRDLSSDPSPPWRCDAPFSLPLTPLSAEHYNAIVTSGSTFIPAHLSILAFIAPIHTTGLRTAIWLSVASFIPPTQTMPFSDTALITRLRSSSRPRGGVVPTPRFSRDHTAPRKKVTKNKLGLTDGRSTDKPMQWALQAVSLNFLFVTRATAALDCIARSLGSALPPPNAGRGSIEAGVLADSATLTPGPSVFLRDRSVVRPPTFRRSST
ncbi:hypothetical protein J3R82DRAFT_8926 [Butyriboletus roseoflavus]|nr:hypothetical protein J3R82DRAFT_8926 [Butyriboletus roseoflavus]